MRLLFVFVLLASACGAFASDYSLLLIGTPDKDCRESGRIATWYLDQLDTHGETVAIICSDEEFFRMCKHTGAVTETAFTLKPKGGLPYVVYIRARALLGDVRSNRGFTPEHIIAHEFAHISTRSVICEVAERTARRMMARLISYDYAVAARN